MINVIRMLLILYQHRNFYQIKSKYWPWDFICIKSNPQWIDMKIISNYYFTITTNVMLYYVISCLSKTHRCFICDMEMSMYFG